MGSIRFCEDQADARGFHAAIIMDLVGHDFALPLPGLANLLVAAASRARVRSRRWSTPARVRPALPLVVVQNDVVGDMSDHHAFRLRDVPYLFLSCGRWAHYHRRPTRPTGWRGRRWR